MADPKSEQKFDPKQIPAYIGRLLWNGKPVGTGFIVHSSGLIATCYHVAAVACKSDSDSPVGETFTFQLLRSGLSVEATVTKKLDRDNDVALLKADPFADKNAVARLISSENVTANTPWQTIGFGDIDDSGHDYQYLPATGTIDGPVGRDQVTLLKLQSSGILQGMSGGPVIALGGVVGLVSARYMIDPSTQTFLRDTGWASRIETLVALDQDSLKLQAPVIPSPPNRLPLIMALLVVVLLAGGVVALASYLFAPKPPDLPAFPFKVAVAGFTVDPSSGMSASDAQDMSQSFYNNFNGTIDALRSEFNSGVGVWAPAEIAKVGTIQGATKEDRAKSAAALADTLKKKYRAADIIVYGTISKTKDGKFSAEPEFYITDNWPDLSEIYGRFALDSAISAPGENLKLELSNQLTDRSKVLSYIAEGVAEMTGQRYKQARDAYGKALNLLTDSGNGLGSGGPGQELVQVLMGNASLGDYNRISAIGADSDRTQLRPLLKQAQASFQAAFDVSKGNYARALIGLAGAQYLNAVDSVAARDAWNEIDPKTLTTIEATYNQALQVSDIPASADIATKIHFGLGQVAVLRDLRHEPGAAATGKKELSQVITDYGNGAKPRVQELAAQAYGTRASLEANGGDFKTALADYSQAIRLTQLDSRKEVFSNAVVQLTFNERRTARDAAGAAKAAEDYLKLNISATDAAKTLFFLGKTYIESSPSQPVKAIAAYERGVAQYAADPVVIADLWHELGDKYYDQGNVSRSSMAYAWAILYDPKQQGHLLRDGIGANFSESWGNFTKGITFTVVTTITPPAVTPTAHPIVTPTAKPTLAATPATTF